MSELNEKSNCKNDNGTISNETKDNQNIIITNNNNNNISSRNRIEANEILKKSKQISSSTTSSSSTETTTIENETDTIRRVIIKDKNKIENCDKNNKNIIETKAELKEDSKTETDKLNNINIKLKETNGNETKINKSIELEKKNNITNTKGLINPVKVKIVELNSIEPNRLTEKQKFLNTTNLLNDSNTKVNGDLKISPAKSILANGTGPRKASLKKSVSFDPDDETIKKFIEGEIIVDKKNPFKNGFIPNGSDDKLSDTLTKQNNSNKKSVFKLRRDKDKTSKFSILNSTTSTPTVSNEPEFITTEEVLNQSKYVKTYIKNPDKVFVYDPTILQRIRYEDLKDLKDKEKPKEKKSKLSAQTQSRLKEFRNKCSSAGAPLQTKLLKTPSAKIPTFKKVSKANYPDLSDIKVKTGTDLEESLFSPEEVTKNAKKFDERIKTLHIGSDDDLEEIDEPLTKSDSSDELKSVADTTDTVDTASSEIKSNTVTNSTIPANDSKSFTNTVNSKEFQEYLDRKGLQLTPQRQILIHSNKVIDTSSTPNSTAKFDISEKKSLNKVPLLETNEMDQKKQKKQSVLQRIKSSGFFSSKRKTTPKDPVPTPVSYPKENGHKTALNNKRVILERQSFHGSSGNSLNSSNEFKKHIERSRKSYAAGDDRSSSISSALTNAEEFPEENQINDSTLRQQSFNKEQQQHRGPRSSSRSSDPGTVQINNSSSSKQQRSRSTSRERLQNFHSSKSQHEARENSGSNLVKPKVQRPSLPISSLKPLPIKSLDRNEKQSATPLKRSLERQSMVQKRVTTPNGDEPQLAFGRSASMDRHEIIKRSGNRQSSSLPKPTRQSVISQKSVSSVNTPKNSKEDLLDPKITSTPIADSKEHKEIKIIQKPLSPIPLNSSNSPNPNASYNVGIEEWNKLKEIKEKTDRELFTRAAQTVGSNKPSISNGPVKPENIYEKVTINQKTSQFQPIASQEQYFPQQVQPQIRKSFQNDLQQQPVYAQLIPEDNFIRGSPQRNTFSGVPLRNRNAKIIDGNPINVPENHIIPIRESENIPNGPYPPRSQSVLDEMLSPGHQNKILHHSPGYPSGVESDSMGTPVRLRRKETASTGSTLTREEILQKVKEFCRKSMNKTPTKLSIANHPAPITSHIHREMNGKIPSDISPISYTSVDSHSRVGNNTPQRKILAPQVPQRIQSLPQTHQISPRETTPSTSPIYAHVIKRNSIQSNASDALDSPTRFQNASGNVIYAQHNGTFTTHSPNGHVVNRPRLQTQTSETDSVFLPNGHIPNQPQQIYIQQQPQGTTTTRSSSSSQFIIMESDKITPSQVMKFRNSPVSPLVTTAGNANNDLYGQIMPPSPYGYIHLKPTPPGPPQLHMRSSRMDGRSTPLILERSVNGPYQGSQIYWTPMQHSPRPLHHSPVPRYSQLNHQQQQPRQQFSPNSSVQRTNQSQPQSQPTQRQHYAQPQQTGSVVFLKVKDQIYRPINPTRANLSCNINQYQQQQQVQQPSMQSPSSLSCQQQQQQNQMTAQLGKARAFLYESESGSEAGEVQRIMQNRKNGIVYFNHYHGCSKCTTVGESYEYRRGFHMSYPKINATLRTDNSFRKRLDPDHHKEYSPLEQLPINMIEDFPIADSLHLFDLGLMRKCLLGWMSGTFNFNTKWSSAQTQKISGYLEKCNKYLPKEIHRAMRPLKDIKYWKGLEFRTFLLYVGPIVLKEFLPSDAYEHFLMLCSAVTICSCRYYLKYLNVAETLFKDYVLKFVEIYGVDSISSNVHSLCHVAADVRKFGHLPLFSSYPFESFLHQMKILIRQGNKPLEQVSRRLIELSRMDINDENRTGCSEKYPYVKCLTQQIHNFPNCIGVYKQVYISEGVMLSCELKNKWFLTKKNEIVEMMNATYCNEKIQICGTSIANKINFFEKPFKSSSLNIFRSSDSLKNSTELYLIEEIKCKLFSLEHNNEIVFLPLLHTLDLFQN